jgi:hypothetical protein
MSDALTSTGQSQAQQQQISINFQNSSDPTLELRILNRVHSAGRQLGRISAVVEVLLDAVAGHPALTTEAGSAAIAQFQKMVKDIEDSKQGYATDYFIAQLEALRTEDPAAYAATAARLRAVLGPPTDGTSPPSGSSSP